MATTATQSERSNTNRLKLTVPQTTVISSPVRFKVVVAGRRFGKTFLALVWLLIIAMSGRKRKCWYVAPTYRMAKEIAWGTLKAILPFGIVAAVNEGELTVVLTNGSVIALKGADNPDKLRGPGLDAVVIDEYAQSHKDLWPLVLRPMLAVSKGPALFIGTPDGFNHFYTLYSDALEVAKDNWDAFQYTTLEGGNVDAEEVEAARRDLSLRQFRQEYEASFEALTSRVYYAFERKFNVVPDLHWSDDLPIKIGMDFNVAPGMHSCAAQRHGDQLHILDEIFIPGGNTEEMARECIRRYGMLPGARRRELQVMPDPTGKSRHTNAPVGQTDLTILGRDYKMKVCAPPASYALTDKFNTTNAALRTASGYSRVFIHQRCKLLIRGFEGLTYKGDTGQPDKSGGLDHITDAAAYLVCWELPMRSKTHIQELRL